MGSLWDALDSQHLEKEPFQTHLGGKLAYTENINFSAFLLQQWNENMSPVKSDTQEMLFITLEHQQCG